MLRTRTCWILSIFALLLAVAANAEAGMLFTADLLGSNEVPPVTTNKFGTATFELNDAETEFTYSIEVTGFDIGGILTPDSADDITGLHIHNAPAGANGSVVFGIFNPVHDPDRVITISSSKIQFSGVWGGSQTGGSPLADQLANLKSGNLYVNVHSTTFPGGEVRGQITAVPEPATGALAIVGLGCFWMLRRRRR